MLRGVVICPDMELSAGLQTALAETQRVGIVRVLTGYPEKVDLVRCMRATVPQVVFLSIESIGTALEVAASIEQQAPGTQVVAINRAFNADALLETMRSGVREFLAMPFELNALQQSLERLEQTLEQNPPAVESTDTVLAFLPSKAGVGCSTVALNTSMMLSELPDTRTLLVDFDLNCGMIGFMLQINSQYSITSAAENSHQMDENLWQKLVTSFGQLDVLTSGKPDPGYRIEATQIRHILEFARHNYRAICLDLSGIMEKFSIEILHESSQILLVCTPEVPSLHLAREKLRLLRTLDLDNRVKILLNRAERRSFIPLSQVEKILGRPVFMSFPNDYLGVHKAVTAAKHVNPSSELGKGFRALAQVIRHPRAPEAPKRGFLEPLRSLRTDALTQ